MKKIILILFCGTQTLYAQNTFYKQYGQGQVQSGIGASCVQQTFDGGYVMTGFIYPPGSDAQVYLVKTDVSGDTMWTNIIGGMTGFHLGNFVQQTSDSGFVITGMYQASEVYLIKTNNNGDTVWTKHFGNSGIGVQGNSVQQTTEGGFIIAGTAFTNSNDVVLIKTNANGDTLWTKSFGGSNSDFGNSVQQTTDGGYIVGGETWSNTAGSSDAYLIKTDLNGDTLWTKKYGNTNGEDVNEVRQTSDGGYIFCGGSTGQIYVVKTDSNGTVVWQKYFGGISADDGTSIKQTADGGYIITGKIEHFSTALGNYVSDACLIKIYSNGNQQWNRDFGPLLGNPSSSYGNFVSQTSDGGYIMTGVNNLDYLIKTDSSGNLATTDDFTEYSIENYFTTIIYPNPSKQNITVVFDNPEKDRFTMALFDCRGELVQIISNINSGSVEIKRQNMASGFYFFQLNSDKRISTGKIILE